MCPFSIVIRATHCKGWPRVCGQAPGRPSRRPLVTSSWVLAHRRFTGGSYVSKRKNKDLQRRKRLDFPLSTAGTPERSIGVSAVREGFYSGRRDSNPRRPAWEAGRVSSENPAIAAHARSDPSTLVRILVILGIRFAMSNGCHAKTLVSRDKHLSRDKKNCPYSTIRRHYTYVVTCPA